MMTGRRRHYLRTLQARFLLALALIGILPLGLVGLGMAMLDRRALAEQSARELTGLARGLAGQLEVYLGNLLSTTRTVAALPEIISLDPARQEPLLKEIFHHNAQLARLSTFDLAGSRLASSHLGVAPAIATRQSFQTAAQRGSQAWEIAVLQSSGRASMLINTPIHDAERRVVGVVGAIIDLVHLSTMVGGVPGGGGGRAFVLDAEGRVLMHPEAAVVQERRDYAWIGVPTGGRPAGPATVRYQIGDEALVAGYAPVPNVNWTVVVERPEQVILAPARRSWQLAVAGLSTSTGLALLMAVILARRLTRPVRALATAVQALAAGDATVPLLATAAPASELQTLLEAFTAMREAVIQREEALRQSEAEAERRQQQAEVLADLARVLNTSLDMDTVLLRVADGAKTLCQADIASLALRDPLSELMILRYRNGRRGPACEEHVIEVGKGIGGQVLLTGRPFRTADYAADPRLTHDYLAIVRQRLLVALMAVPITLGDRVEGLLYVGGQTTRPFTDRDETMLLQLADHAAVAIQNARLYQQQALHQTEVRTVLEINKTLGQVRELPALLNAIAAEAARLLAVPLVTFRLREGNALPVKGSWAQTGLVPSNTNLHVGENLGGRVVATGEPLMVNDITFDDRPLSEYRSRMVQLGYTAYLGVPLRLGAEVIGVMGFRAERTRPFTDHDRDLAVAFADQAVIAVQHARLYQEAQEAYRQLVHTQEQLLQAQKMEAVGQLAGGVAHDFNNLLTVIIGRAQFLLAHGLPAEPVRRDVEQIQAAANRAATLTRQLLAFSRKQVLQPSVLDLNVLVADMDTMLQPLLSEDIALTTVLDPDLGRVKVDRGQFDQVLLNLVVNARDAMPQGGKLTLETANIVLDDTAMHDCLDLRPGPYVRLQVRDTGVGMDAKTQAHLFEPFFTTKGPGQGTGLGLATVYGIVIQSGGHITVDSVLGQGTMFTIYLPRIEEAVDTSEPGPDQEGPTLAGETVVLVEDNTAVRDITQTILQQHGYTVLVAANGHEALQRSAQYDAPIHLLLTDVVMPEMSGPEVADCLARLRPELRVLYMSGYTDDALRQHGVLDLGTALLPKPFTTYSLLQKVHEVLHPVHTAGACLKEEA